MPGIKSTRLNDQEKEEGRRRLAHPWLSDAAVFLAHLSGPNFFHAFAMNGVINCKLASS
ncbi:MULTISPECIES: hypothetical protein [unclassified Herbaspirillum]|uniref:hypothetical protein n=1 Tax=unclassified Herbaspirillum TaxID=2624150 RepID=UPI00131498D2|nr:MULTISPECIES: hypothetical protein [unclassified Herbaspirillum]